MAKKSVVVLGAGFGGLRAAMDISKKLSGLKLLEAYEVVLVDRGDCQLYTPLLYKLAGAPNTPRETCTYDITSLVKKSPIRFVQSEISAVDTATGTIKFKTGDDLHADYLVLALGSETNYFGIPGLKENALQLKTVENAMQIRDAVTKAFAKGGDVHIVAGGAGPNGIELAAEIRAWATRVQEDNRQLKSVAISIVEAMPTILPGFDRNVAAHALIRLEKLDVAVRTNAKITGVTANEIMIAGNTATAGSTGAVPPVPLPPAPPEKIPFDVFIWTGGIKAPDITTGMVVDKEAHGKPLAKSDLKIAPMVYGLGDSVMFMNPKTGKPVPAVARAAISEGSVVANNVVEEIKQAERSGYNAKAAVYTPANYPYVIPIGENWAVAKIGPLVFWGWPGAMFEKLIALNYLISIMPLEEAFTSWKRM